MSEELLAKVRELVDLCAHCGFEWEILDEVIELLEKEGDQ
jgi:hypothetical protein